MVYINLSAGIHFHTTKYNHKCVYIYKQHIYIHTNVCLYLKTYNIHTHVCIIDAVLSLYTVSKITTKQLNFPSFLLLLLHIVYRKSLKSLGTT